MLLFTVFFKVGIEMTQRTSSWAVLRASVYLISSVYFGQIILTINGWASQLRSGKNSRDHIVVVLESEFI